MDILLRCKICNSDATIIYSGVFKDPEENITYMEMAIECTTTGCRNQRSPEIFKQTVTSFTILKADPLDFLRN